MTPVFRIYFGDADAPAAELQTESDQPTEVVWRVISGPDSWIDTVIIGTEGTGFHPYPEGEISRWS